MSRYLCVIGAFRLRISICIIETRGFAGINYRCDQVDVCGFTTAFIHRRRSVTSMRDMRGRIRGVPLVALLIESNVGLEILKHELGWRFVFGWRDILFDRVSWIEFLRLIVLL